jgi:enamine deaminase RidA (YjgF/YER057c/UK114 family)
LEETVARQNISAKTPWEDAFGYSRAVRIGNVITVGGTTATDEEGTIFGGEDIYQQAVYALRKIEAALEEAGARLADVVRTRCFVTDIDDWENLARAHAEFFGDIRPATTLVEVSRFIRPEYLVEIEAEAILQT